MTNDAAIVNTWEQYRMFDIDPTMVRLTIGIVPGDDRVQIQLEALNPATDVLEILESRPYLHFSDVDRVLPHFLARLTQIVSDRTGPF